MYNLDADRSVGTINKRNNGKYKGSPGAPVLNLGKKFASQVDMIEINFDNGDIVSGVSGVSGLSRGAILRLLKEERNKNKETELDSKSSGDEHDKLRTNTSFIHNDVLSLSSGSLSESSADSVESMTDAVGVG